MPKKKTIAPIKPVVLEPQLPEEIQELEFLEWIPEEIVNVQEQPRKLKVTPLSSAIAGDLIEVERYRTLEGVQKHRYLVAVEMRMLPVGQVLHHVLAKGNVYMADTKLKDDPEDAKIVCIYSYEYPLPWLKTPEMVEKKASRAKNVGKKSKKASQSGDEAS
jgi:hypothetical protein